MEVNVTKLEILKLRIVFVRLIYVITSFIHLTGILPEIRALLKNAA